jgi:mannose PTS system EIID component
MTSPGRHPPVPPAAVSSGTWLNTYLRLLAIQGSWNYEILMGTGMGFVLEPSLRSLPGGKGGAAYREALARQSRYFNAHPYLAAIAVGALARAELDGEDPHRIERFRTALCGPLGSVGDRLIWAAWLPFCSLVSLAAYGLEASTATVLFIFLGLYNLGHLPLRAWGLAVGLSKGMRIASALGHPLLREAPEYIARAGALLAGIAIPLAMHRAIGPGRALAGVVVVAAVIGSILLARIPGSVGGWRAALVTLSVFILYSVLR